MHKFITRSDGQEAVTVHLSHAELLTIARGLTPWKDTPAPLLQRLYRAKVRLERGLRTRGAADA